MSKESHVWGVVRNALISIGGGMHYNRIETHSTALGYPDVEYCFRGTMNQIELKFVKNITDTIEIRPSQIMWFTERVRCGGTPIMITGVGRTGAVCGMDVEQMVMLHYGDDVMRMQGIKADVAMSRARNVWYNEIDLEEFQREIMSPWYQKDELVEVGGKR